MSTYLDQQNELQQQAKELLATTQLLSLFETIGTPVQTGSSVTGLMAYPDIDFALQTNQPDFQKAVKLVPDIISQLSATSCKIATFANNPAETAYFYVGFTMPFNGRSWEISATACGMGTIQTNPPELSQWLATMTDEQRRTIIQLKHELIAARRYVGSKSQPPYTFRSVHLYEGVLKGNSKTIADLETYFAQ